MLTTPQSQRQTPDHYEDLDTVLETAMELMADGVANRKSAFHTISVASHGIDGHPKTRIVVLRGFDPVARTLRFHTDVRSRKIAEIVEEPRISVLGYDPIGKIQIRLSARATVMEEGKAYQKAWAATRSFSRACYRTIPEPGSAIATGGAFDMPDGATADAGRENFRVVLASFDDLEWLYLAASGHRRATFHWDAGGNLSSTWLVP